MGIEIGPFTLTCTDCDEQIQISRHTARSPESMLLFKEKTEQTHRCKRTPEHGNLDDRWNDLLARARAAIVH